VIVWRPRSQIPTRAGITVYTGSTAVGQHHLWTLSRRRSEVVAGDRQKLVTTLMTAEEAELWEEIKMSGYEHGGSID
jgi:hypothetical protein